MTKTKDFQGFRFGNIHSTDLNLVVVSSSNRYEKNLLPDPTDYTTDVPGSDGQYYFGQTYKNRTFTVNVAFNKVSEQNFRQISQLFSTDKLQDLVFDEMPYKTFRAKLRAKPEFKFICFTDRDSGERVYKGEGTLNFICYFPYAFGFNKYVVHAADYYQCLQPAEIITNSIEDSPYRRKKKPKLLTGLIKDHYNVAPNMNTPWTGGYPSKEQVQWGELYFKDSNTNEDKMIIDVRNYWENIPEWQGTAKLLTTPTLDFDKELIYLPQYSKTNYINMDTGLNRQNGLIGSRILVYNPGDLPVDFELRLGNLSSEFRKNLDNYTFRISRYNVQRLTIEQAVDWTGLKTYNRDDDSDYKYGNRYFTILENSKTDNKEPIYKSLKKSHPHHTYVVEPIPKEHLGDFIKLFYWQSQLLKNGNSNCLCDYEEGKRYADRYEELYNLCITEEEKYELYWQTLEQAILQQYNKVNQILSDEDESLAIFNDDYTYEDFVYDYIYNPPEYIRDNGNQDYGQFQFNNTQLPSYYTYDYFDISSENFKEILSGCCGADTCEKTPIANRSTTVPLFLDTEERMLYNIEEPEWKNNEKWIDENPKLIDNFYNFKPTKNILNDNIIRGHWFKIPPGWSLIDISPIVDEDLWGGKRWLDGRPFYWGTPDESFREDFNSVYKAAATEYIAQNCPKSVFQIKQYADKQGGAPTDYSAAGLKKYLNNLTYSDDIENYIQFRRWYEGQSIFEKYGTMDEYYQTVKNTIYGLGYEIQRKRVESAEYGYLKLLADYWRVNHLDENGQPIGDIDDWWWYANDYIWNNFPPLYWGYADLLNQLQIKYIPLFY